MTRLLIRLCLALSLLLPLAAASTLHAVAQPAGAVEETQAGAALPPTPTPTPTKAADLPAPTTDAATAAPNAAELSARFATQQTWLAIIIAAVIIVAFCAMYAFRRAENDFSRHYIVIVVVVSAIFLLVMGYSEQQVAPAFGLLGTILGYMFGRASAVADRNAVAPVTPVPDAGPPTPPPERSGKPATLAEMDAI